MSPGEEEIVFYYLIGKALSQWASVEGQLRHLVAGSVSPVDGIAVGTGFLSIESFRSKLAFADKLILRKNARSGLAADWQALSKKIASASTRRNHIAHGKAVFFPPEAEGRRFGLVQWLRSKAAEPKKEGMAPSTAMCLLELEIARKEFHDLTVAVSDFYELSCGRPVPFPASAGQQGGRRTVQAIRDQIRAALQVQRQS